VAALGTGLLAVGILAAVALYTSSHIGVRKMVGQLVFDVAIVAVSVPIALRALRRRQLGRRRRQVIISCVGGGSIVNLLATPIAEIAASGTGIDLYIGIFAAFMSLLAIVAWLVGLWLWGAAEGKTFFAPGCKS